ncbi:histone-lysine N-methyltransferase set-1-like [Triplophysa dalaica]|uniref:histone-lysine N-methyltransferase set-1-like n=1 Tax=Triplophysa dalaica TaxID=1582913 RepID=UPI0024DF8043|nr:histone-lysine N-methyltransferase set-1-like [Triplophysa dalaica]
MIEHLRISTFDTENIFTRKAKMPRKKRIHPEHDAKEHVLTGKDKAFIEERHINSFKGRGLFAVEHIEKSTFVVQYRGILSQSKHVEDIQGNYLFDFTWNGRHYCIDASNEDGSLGRLVNDDHINPNCKVKTVVFKEKPHLCLFSIRDLFPDEDITYNYGDSSWPWRSMELGDKSSGTADDCSFQPSSSENQSVIPSSDKEKVSEDVFLQNTDVMLDVESFYVPNILMVVLFLSLGLVDVLSSLCEAIVQ